MLAVGRERAQRAGHDITFVEGNAEALPLPDRSFDVVTIAFGIRNVPRIDAALTEAHRVLKIGGRFLCLEFSSVDVPGLDRLYDLYSFNVIPALGRAVAGDAEAYRYLVESIRKFPRPAIFADMIRGAGFRRVSFRRSPAASLRCTPAGGCDAIAAAVIPGHTRVDLRIQTHPPSSLVEFGFAPVARRPAMTGTRMIAAIAHLARLGRAGFVLAREGVFALPDPKPLPLPARTAIRLARLIERPTGASAEHRLPARSRKLGPTYVKLGQFLATRPDVVGIAIARDLESCRTRWRRSRSTRPRPRSRPRSASR